MSLLTTVRQTLAAGKEQPQPTAAQLANWGRFYAIRYNLYAERWGVWDKQAIKWAAGGAIYTEAEALEIRRMNAAGLTL